MHIELELNSGFAGVALKADEVDVGDGGWKMLAETDD
jgi:hypothetical protein